MSANEVLLEIASQVNECKSCSLHHSRKRSVPGEGPFQAEIMLIGEGPGFYENEQGRPFVGAAGKFLDELLAKGGLKREDVFITNVVKCRPPGNRDPMPEELAACGNFLERQIQAINPRIIITLGRFSMARFFNNVRISDVHGKPRWMNGRLIIPMYHPAAALHQPAFRAPLEHDFSRLPEFLEASKKGQPGLHKVSESAPPPYHPKPAQPAQQLNLLDAQTTPEPVEEKEEVSPPPANNTPTQLSLF